MYHTSYKQFRFFSLIDKVYMKEISLLTHDIFKNKTMYIYRSQCANPNSKSVKKNIPLLCRLTFQMGLIHNKDCRFAHFSIETVYLKQMT